VKPFQKKEFWLIHIVVATVVVADLTTVSVAAVSNL
jgi:hypothetical protein